MQKVLNIFSEESLHTNMRCEKTAYALRNYIFRKKYTYESLKISKLLNV